MSSKSFSPRDDFYGILEVSPKARESVIEAAYKTLMKEYHPDKKTGDERVAKYLNEARDYLLDPVKREAYDSTRNELEGKIIGNYRVLEVIAEGGFGKTYKGEHILAESPVCIKHAHKISPQNERILIDEAKAIWDLRHYGIPTVRDLLKIDQGGIVLVTSYVPGPTLEQVVEKTKRLEAEDLSWIVTRGLNVLKYLHYHGVVHGDIKPQNIILQPDTHGVVLVDYGISAVRPKHEDENKGHTPIYASPEQIGGGTLLPQSDFYSLGMTMIQALGGDVQARKVPENVPDPLCGFIKKLIVRNVLSRPSWEHEDLCQTFEDVRKESFGRSHSGFSKIKGWTA